MLQLRTCLSKDTIEREYKGHGIGEDIYHLETTKALFPGCIVPRSLRKRKAGCAEKSPD